MATLRLWKRLLDESYLISGQITGCSSPKAWIVWLEAIRLWVTGFR